MYTPVVCNKICHARKPLSGERRAAPDQSSRCRVSVVRAHVGRRGQLAPVSRGLGSLAARAGGAAVITAAARVTFWGPWPWHYGRNRGALRGCRLRSAVLDLWTQRRL